MITVEEIISFLKSDLPYAEQIVFLIKQDKKIYSASSFGEVISCIHHSTVKLQSMEKYSSNIHQMCDKLRKDNDHNGPVTCHLFYANSENSPSFGLHKDTDDVVIIVCDGTKHMEINGEQVVLHQNDTVFIPAGTEHKAVNYCPNVILSFGLEKYLVDKI
jgi:mannose-6-phosphate isomerase-like protein (cupin superfamily)